MHRLGYSWGLLAFGKLKELASVQQTANETLLIGQIGGASGYARDMLLKLCVCKFHDGRRRLSSSIQSFRPSG